MKANFQRVAVVILVLCLGFGAWYFYDRFRSRSPEEKIAYIIYQENTRKLSDDLIDLLGDEDSEVASQAALAIGRIGNNDGGEPLFAHIEDSSQDVASAAAFALGLMGDHQYAAKLLEKASYLPAGVAASCVLAAGELVDSTNPEVGADIARYLNHPSAEVREASCYAIFQAKDKEAGPQIASMMQTESDSLVREAGLYALARLGLDDGTPYFVEFLASADPYHRSLAVRGLGKSSDPQAEHYVAIALNDVSVGVEAQAIASIAAHKTPKAAEYLAKKFAVTADENLQVELLNQLRTLKSDLAVTKASELLLSTPSPNVIGATMEYVASVDTDRAVDLIDSILATNPSPSIRAAGVRSYRAINDPGLISRVTILFSDPSPQVRAEAFDALCVMDMTNIEFLIRRALEDEDPVLVVTAIDKIKEGHLTQFLPKFDSLLKEKDDIDVDIRRSIVDAVPMFLQSSGNDTAAIQLLNSGLLDPEYIVQREAATVYEQELGRNEWAAVAPIVPSFTRAEIRDARVRYAEKNPRATIVTTKGDMQMELYFESAPMTVLEFMKLVREGFYAGKTFHRIVPNFVVQGGDPRGDGSGGPGYFIRCEYSTEPFLRGTVGIATSGKDTGGSQFFITLSPQPHLNGRYTVFGQVTDGMNVAEQLVRGDTIQQIILQEGKT